MPTSRPNHIGYLATQVLEIQPKSILDIGIGFGSKGMLFREMTDIWNGRYEAWETRIDGIEIFEKYITELQEKIYTNIYIGNVLDIIDTLPNYDFIYMGDVIEHLTKEDGLELLEKLRSKAKVVIIATPLLVSNQGAINGNKNETHLSQWNFEDFNGAEINTFGSVLVAKFEKMKVYYCGAMKTFGEKLKMERYNPLTDIDKSVFFQGLYFDEDYEVFRNHRGYKEVFWNGSDVLRLLRSPERVSIIKEFKAKHTCHNKQLQDELASVGIEAMIKPMFFGDIEDYPVSYKPSDKPQVYITCNEGREEEYGVPQVLEKAKELKEFTFHIYGINGTNTDNVIYHGWTDKMDEETKSFQAVIRLNKHDGFSQTVMKGILMGQHVIRDLNELQFLKNKEQNNDREELIYELDRRN